MNRLRKGKPGESTISGPESDEYKYSRRRVHVRWTVVSVVLGWVVWVGIASKESKLSAQKSAFHARGSVEDHGISAADVLAERNVTVTEPFQGHAFKVTPIAASQIENYKRGTALIVNVHFTHHGGTFACHALGKAPGQTGSPSFACMGVTDADNITAADLPQPDRVPWTKEETSNNILRVRPWFHFLNWEFGAPELAQWKRPLFSGDWENPNLVSILIVREPLSRLLAIDGWVRKNHPNILTNTATRQEWIDFALTPHNNTNNFALAILAGNDCCQGKNTRTVHLRNAKDLVRRFTFVLDIACLQAGLSEVAHLLGFEAHSVERRLSEADVSRDLKLHRRWPPPKERIPPKIYDLLVERNRLDIELYEWCKEISLVQCR